jgi:UDP-N-acetylmuramate dehydrogenase
MLLSENLQLRDRHTFHMDVKSRYWADFESVEELCTLLKDSRFFSLPKRTVGGGSNLLFTRDFPGLLLHSALHAIESTVQTDGSILVRAGSGVVWDDLVAHTVRNGWCGLENLSGIPGEVGATPVQNIGAYGSEVKDCIETVEALNTETLELHTFLNADCQFGYRDSIFKKGLKDKFIVCYVTYRLSKYCKPNIRYGDLSRRLEVLGNPTLENIRKTILEIRAEKLPDPNVQGNAGSFFMNPEIPEGQFRELHEKWPEMPSWPQGNGKIKISAAWCIEQAGWKGRKLGNAAVHDKQALVLVNTGKAVADEVIELCNCIVTEVENRFGIKLHPEVLFI